MIGLTIGWPDRALHPNARVHWAKKSKATKAAREEAYWLTKALGRIEVPDGPLVLHLECTPPTNRRRDDDGIIASFKPYRDGIAEALGIDDSRFRTMPPTILEAFAPGLIVVRIAAFDAYSVPAAFPVHIRRPL